MSPLLVLLVALAASGPVLDPATLEATAKRLETKFVAPCCWSQQVSVHQSPAADEVKRDLRTRLGRGETEEQIVSDYVVQFGDRILVEPPARGFNRFLYVLPPVFLLAGAGLVIVLVRRFSKRGAEAEPRPTTAPGSDARYSDRLDDELSNLD